ncbi:MAG: hypothetical protein M1838_003012 [Thelocarpon superellum]|nr:MAG: hypothetical protein M1838_003012 [Thelocarpon superellum]
MPEVDPLISNYSHLKDQPREAEALKTLQKIASLVKPVMRQRSWRVGTLAEFIPQEHNLLGVNWNKGQKICLRLRYPGDARQFLPLEQVVDTMLHELSHIVHDAHDAKFHALWQQLRDEHEQLARKGYTGEGFLSEGRKLGGRRIPMDEARRRARAAAEKRRVLTAGSGQRLGGAPVLRGSDMRRVIADAVQRRLTVTKGCGAGSKDTKAIVDRATRTGFSTQAEEDDANERAIMQAYMELVQHEERQKWGDAYEAPSKQNPLGSASNRQQIVDDDVDDESQEDERSISTEHVQRPVPPPRVSPPAAPMTDYSFSDTWTCPICTLENPNNYLCCDACATERPVDLTGSAEARRRSRQGNERIPVASASLASPQPEHWICHACDTYMEAQWWTCSNCGVMKLSS